MTLRINDFKVYMPAKDFEKSKRFYTMLGFTMSEGWGGTADGGTATLNSMAVPSDCRTTMSKIGLKTSWLKSASMMSRHGINERRRLRAVENSTAFPSSHRRTSMVSVFFTSLIRQACSLFSCNS